MGGSEGWRCAWQKTQLSKCPEPGESVVSPGSGRRRLCWVQGETLARRLGSKQATPEGLASLQEELDVFPRVHRTRRRFEVGKWHRACVCVSLSRRLSCSAEEGKSLGGNVGPGVGGEKCSEVTRSGD